MNIYKSDKILGKNLSVLPELKLDAEVSDMGRDLPENNNLVDQMSLKEDEALSVEMENDISSTDGGHFEEANEKEREINSSSRDVIPHNLGILGKEDFDKALENMQSKDPEHVLEVRELPDLESKTLTTESAIFMHVNNKTWEENGANDGILRVINTSEDGLFREVSVQTVGGKLFITNDSCPICKLEDEDLKDTLTAYCLECPPYKKLKVVGFHSSADDVDENLVEREETGSRKKMAQPENQTVSKCIPFIENTKGKHLIFPRVLPVSQNHLQYPHQFCSLKKDNSRVVASFEEIKNKYFSL